MAETVQLAAESGVDAIYFQPLDLIGIEDRRNELVGKLTYHALERELRRALEASRRVPVNTNLRLLLRTCPCTGKNTCSKLANTTGVSACYPGFDIHDP
jgi:hypothetical protein